MKTINIIGAGLAGSETAYQIAQRGIKVNLYEMRPEFQTEVHKTAHFAELVCSNSFRSSKVENAVGLLKKEMEIVGSLIMEVAYKTRVPAGNALSVNRELFSSLITKTLKEHENITVVKQKVATLDKNAINIIATGPVTDNEFAEKIQSMTGENSLYFYDAIAPVIDADSVDYNCAFFADRYADNVDGEADYLNIPMNKETYETFVRELINSEKTPSRDFEKELFFEACLPIETIASRGMETLRFGTMKPVGLKDSEGKEHHAVIQLRKENKEGTAFNLVGCQTRMKISEQKRVFSLIPALRNAEFLKLGSMHRNTYINAP
ncbi:MAG: methylenetetrahydrofolate--tRNA-(uracil(54)-C(5))-methyltransferase (FADH(2)-oxidizing) TrmFO, partial [Nitrospinae bacterium]|nr:methylenetetrahydrofolate--tRNA-(uracil(54)-C(5))-methyltransferase (FADH(2)-oxidizing) TrmFO [Nitrospinota bacterium]